LALNLSGTGLQGTFQQKGRVVGERTPLLIGRILQSLHHVLAHSDGEAARLTEDSRHQKRSELLWNAATVRLH
jgi:hypothetical protein